MNPRLSSTGADLWVFNALASCVLDDPGTVRVRRIQIPFYEIGHRVTTAFAGLKVRTGSTGLANPPARGAQSHQSRMVLPLGFELEHGQGFGRQKRATGYNAVAPGADEHVSGLAPVRSQRGEDLVIRPMVAEHGHKGAVDLERQTVSFTEIGQHRPEAHVLLVCRAVLPCPKAPPTRWFEPQKLDFVQFANK